MPGKKILFGTAVLAVVLLGLVGAFLSKALDDPPYDNIPKETISSTRTADLRPRSIWSFHTALDSTVFVVSRLLTGDKRYFRDGVASRSFEEHLAAVHNKLPQWKGEGLYELEAQTAEGVMFPAFRVHRWHGDRAPTLIYHHGASQIPFDGVFNAIFDPEKLPPDLAANLIVVRTPFHQKGRLELLEGGATLSRFLALMAVSVRVTEHLVQALRARGVKHVGVVGISMGGFIANRHRVHYGSATFYAPVVAGTAFAEVLLREADPRARPHAAAIREHLNFRDKWRKAAPENVFPILGRFDAVCRLEEQGPSYGGTPVEIWDCGHLTTVLAVRALRHFFLKQLPP